MGDCYSVLTPMLGTPDPLERSSGAERAQVEAHMSQTMKPKHFGSPPLRRQCEATAAKPAATGFTPALLGKPLPLGRGWGRQGEPRERCAPKESISRKT